MYSNAFTLCLPSVMTKFEGGPLDRGLGGFRLRDAIFQQEAPLTL